MKKKVYLWKEMSSSITIKDTPLPTDKRKRPHPAIRKKGWKNINTRGELLRKFLEEGQKSLRRELAKKLFRN